MTLVYSDVQNGSSGQPPSIVVIDSHPFLRSCFARVLRCEFQDFTVLEVEDAHNLDSSIGRQVSIIALNIGNKSMMDECVLQNLSCLRRQMPEVPFILLTQQHESTITDAMISEASRFGVRGCIPGSASVEITLAALRLVIAGGTYFPRSVVMDSDELLDWRRVSPERTIVTQPAIPLNDVLFHATDTTRRMCVAFTEREQQVVATLQRGLSNKTIAHELHLSQNTVKTHISHIMRKLEVSNRTEAALAVQRNLQVQTTKRGHLHDQGDAP